MHKHIKTEVIINAAKEKVWTLLTNFESYPLWNPFIVAIEGQLKQGARLKVKIKSQGKTMSFKPVVQNCKPLYSFTWMGQLFVKGVFDGYHYFEIEEIKTDQIKFTQGEKFSGLLSNYIFNKIGVETKNNFIRMNDALKQLSEQH